MKTTFASLAVVGALAIAGTERASATSFLEFGSQFTNITTTNLTPDNTFDVGFSGSLGLSGNPQTMYLGALLDGLFVGNPHGYEFHSIDGQIDFLNGDITGGFLEFSIGTPGKDDLVFDTFTAQFAATDHSISKDPMHNQFSITGGLTNIEFTPGNGGNTFAGFDISNFLGFGETIIGSFFAFTYDGSIVDNTTGFVATAVIPLPAAAWMGLIGLAAVGFLRRRAVAAT